MRPAADQGTPARALAVVLLACCWPAAEHLVFPPDLTRALALSTAGLLVLVWSLGPGSITSRPGATGLAAVAALSAWKALTSVGPAVFLYVIAMVCLLAPLTPHLRRVRWIGALAVGGLTLVLTGASTWLLKEAAWRLRGLPASLSEGAVRAWTGERIVDVGVTPEALGLYFVWYLAVASGILAALPNHRDGLRPASAAILRWSGTVALYACLRLAATAVLAVELDRPALIAHPDYAVFSWLPLSIPLGWLSRKRLRENPAPASAFAPMPAPARDRAAPGRPWLRCWAAAAAGLCAAFAVAFDDPGILKPGRVLIDNRHSNWEWTGQPFDTTAFGIRAEYNYSCLLEHLGHFYAISTADTVAGGLESTDVLIIKTPTAAYSNAEIAEITGFVERGGGLLLVGDHTNLFGMTTYLNEIAAPFDMRFNPDDTFDIATTGLSTYRPGRPPPHPAVRGIKRFEFLTSCTVAASLCAEPAILGCGLASEDGAYSHPNFFGNLAFDLRDRFGVFLQAASRRFGRGRVFLFGDSTCFSNFCLYGPGKRELLLGAVDYLNRRGRRLPGARVVSLLAATVLAAAALGRRPQPAGNLSAVWLPATAAFFAGVSLTGWFNAWAYGSIRPVVPLSTVVFDTEHTGAVFFDYLGVDPAPPSHHFEEFYLCAQRMGLHPVPGSAGDTEICRPLAKPLALVVVCPNKSLGRRAVERLVSYVNGGGTLLLLDSITNSGSTAAEILTPLGLGTGVVPARGRGEVIPALRAFAPETAQPGTPAAEGEPRIVADVGAGRVVVATDAFRYSAGMLGRPLDRRLPGPDILLLYNEIYALYRQVRGAGIR